METKARAAPTSREVTLKLQEVSRMYKQKKIDTYENLQRAYLNKDCTFQPNVMRVGKNMDHEVRSRSRSLSPAPARRSRTLSLSRKNELPLPKQRSKSIERIDIEEKERLDEREEKDNKARRSSRKRRGSEDLANVYERLFQESEERRAEKEKRLIQHKISTNVLEKKRIEQLRAKAAAKQAKFHQKLERDKEDNKLISREPLYDPKWVEQKLRLRDSQKAQDDVKGCTFKPEINRRSEKIAKRNFSGQSTQVHQRLFEAADYHAPLLKIKLDLSKLNANLEGFPHTQRRNSRTSTTSSIIDDDKLEMQNESESGMSTTAFDVLDERDSIKSTLHDKEHHFGNTQQESFTSQTVFAEATTEKDMIVDNHSICGSENEVERSSVSSGISKPEESKNETSSATKGSQMNKSEIGNPEPSSRLSPSYFERSFQLLKSEGSFIEKYCRHGPAHYTRLSADNYSLCWVSRNGSIKRIGWNYVINVVKGRRVNVRSNSALSWFSRRVSSTKRRGSAASHAMSDSLIVTIICEQRDLTFATFDEGQRDEIMAALMFGMGAVKNTPKQPTEEIATSKVEKIVAVEGEENHSVYSENSSAAKSRTGHGAKDDKTSIYTLLDSRGVEMKEKDATEFTTPSISKEDESEVHFSPAEKQEELSQPRSRSQTSLPPISLETVISSERVFDTVEEYPSELFPPPPPPDTPPVDSVDYFLSFSPSSPPSPPSLPLPPPPSSPAPTTSLLSELPLPPNSHQHRTNIHDEDVENQEDLNASDFDDSDVLEALAAMGYDSDCANSPSQTGWN